MAPEGVLVLKVLLTPALIGLISLVERKFGHGVAGWFAALPMTSGPVSVFLAVELGPRFAQDAAIGTMVGIGAVSLFCLGYAHTAKLGPWPLALSVAYALFFAGATFFALLDFRLAAAVIITFPVLLVALLAMPRDRVRRRLPVPLRMEVPLRMLVATVIVVGLTEAAARLGSDWTGVLSPVPVFATVLASFAHHRAGPRAPRRLLRGIVAGSFGFGTFFAVVALLLPEAPLLPTYLVASLAALGVNAFTLGYVRRGDAPA